MSATPPNSYKPVPLPDKRSLADEESLTAAQGFLAEMQTRHSIRQFSDRPVPRAVIDACVAAAGRAPSGANHQPWHFVAVSDAKLKADIRKVADQAEQSFYNGGASDEWLKALEPIGTGPEKPHLEAAPWLIVVFAQRWGEKADGSRYKHYYVPESVGLACGFLITALHMAGLSSLVHTPNPMKFLNKLLDRPQSEKPVMIIAAGHAADDATIPEAATHKKPLSDILTVMD